MKQENKIYLRSLDQVFRLVAIEPDLPDAETYSGEFFQRVLHKPGQTFHTAELAFSSEAKGEYEVFQKESIRGLKGARFYYWTKQAK